MLIGQFKRLVRDAPGPLPELLRSVGLKRRDAAGGEPPAGRPCTARLERAGRKGPRLQYGNVRAAGVMKMDLVEIGFAKSHEVRIKACRAQSRHVAGQLGLHECNGEVRAATLMKPDDEPAIGEHAVAVLPVVSGQQLAETQLL